jgi:hypothetical protein
LLPPAPAPGALCLVHRQEMRLMCYHYLAEPVWMCTPPVVCVAVVVLLHSVVCDFVQGA